MNTTISEEQLTAYALGELDGAERAAVEAHLAENEAARKVVEEVRATAGVLTGELQKEHSPGLTEEQREAIAAASSLPAVQRIAAVAPRSARPLFGFSKRLWLAMAASVVLVVGIVGVILPMFDRARESARRTAQVGAKAFGEAEGIHRRTDYASDGVAEYSQPIPGERSANEKRLRDLFSADIHESAGAALLDPAKRPPTSQPESAQAHKNPKLPVDPVQGLYSSSTEAKERFNRPRFAMPDGGPQKEVGRKGKEEKLAQAKEKLEVQKLKKDVENLRKRLPEKPQPDETTKTIMALTDDEGLADANEESYDHIVDNPFLGVMQNPLSTFSIDVDTASYSNLRRHLLNRQRPPRDMVRIEELINYFPYSYAQPTGEDPFAVHVEIAQCPWEPEHRLARVGLKGREIPQDQRPASNLVFLLDVSGSMADANKLPLVQSSMKLLVNRLTEKDRVAIVTYSDSASLALPSTPCNQEATIIKAIEALHAGGSTNGAGGIQLAYQTAEKSFLKEGTNRVILATDGDFNVGITNQGDLVRLIEEKRKSGIFLTVLGYGMGNLKDSTLEKLADKGNGHYAYIDDLKESNKVLVEQLSGTLVAIAKDVKIQVEFNPGQVSAYRLIGYENRVLAAEDFNNDKKDAGEIGAGHTVTALYELVPVGKKADLAPPVDPLRYQISTSLTDAAFTEELLTLKLRYKQPHGDTSKLLEIPVKDSGNRYSKASPDFKFAAAVASFGLLLRQSPYKGNATWDSIVELATEAKGEDKGGHRAEFIELVNIAKTMK